MSAEGLGLFNISWNSTFLTEDLLNSEQELKSGRNQNFIVAMQPLSKELINSMRLKKIYVSNISAESKKKK